jgi:ATP-binding cassette subfamily G (WHITE) protein 2 (PDR)
VAELVWNTGVAIACFLVWYYPMGLFRNARWTDIVHTKSTLVSLVIWSAFLFGSTLAHALIAGAPTAEAASALGNVSGIMMYAFAGLLVQPKNLPKFWIFMYRVNPFTYLTSSFLSAAIGEAPVQCAADELLGMRSPGSQTCEQYLSSYITSAGGVIIDPSATSVCQYCPVKDTTQFLEAVGINFDDRWRNYGLMWVYICVNIAAVVAL